MIQRGSGRLEWQTTGPPSARDADEPPDGAVPEPETRDDVSEAGPYERELDQEVLDDTEEGVGPFAGYGRVDRQFYSYIVLLAVYSGLFASFLAASRRLGRPLPREVQVRDVVMVGLASHRLSRLVSRDRVTAPIRAPFTRYEGRGSGPNEVDEKARGFGLRRSIGELLTCPFCAGVWISSVLSYGYVLLPRHARVVSMMFAADAIAEFLHLLHVRIRRR